jgi:hypothetical protein
LLHRANSNPETAVFNSSGTLHYNKSKNTGEYGAGVGDLDNDGFADDTVFSINNEIVAYNNSGDLLWNFTTDNSNVVVDNRMPVGDLDNDFAGCMIKFADRLTYAFMDFDKVNNSLYRYDRYYPDEGEYAYTINCTALNNVYQEASFTGNVTVDSTLPSISNWSDSPDPATPDATVTIAATVTDNVRLDDVWTEVLQPSGSASNTTMSAAGDPQFTLSYSNTSATGTYTWKVYANDTGGNVNVTGAQTFAVQAAGAAGKLNVTLLTPVGGNSQPQNVTFTLSANVTCSGSSGDVCGEVNGTLMYNASIATPNQTVSGSGVSDVPFYTIEANPLGCGYLSFGDTPCGLSWTVNTTGTIGDDWTLGVNFTSNRTAAASNLTNFTTISIIAPTFSITLSNPLADVRFTDSLEPGTNDNAATNNSLSTYNITCGSDLGLCNVSIKGNSDLQSGSNFLGVTNVSWSHLNSAATENKLTTSLAVINSSLANAAVQKLFFWLDIPSAQTAGDYSGNFTIQGQSD